MLTVPGSCRRTWCHAPVGSTTPSSSTTHCGLGRRSVQLGAPPVAVGPHDRAAALGAHPRVVLPALAGAEPGDLRRGDRRPGHHRVVGVGHDVHGRVRGERRAPQLRHHRDLLRAVELVAGEVEQRDGARRRSPRGPGPGSARRPPGRRTAWRPPWPAPRCARSACWRRTRWWRPGRACPAPRRSAWWSWSCRWCRRRGRPAGRPPGARAGPGSIFRPIQPPITEPSPRPAARERAAAVRDTELATFARRGIFGSVTRARLPDDL